MRRNLAVSLFNLVLYLPPVKAYIDNKEKEISDEFRQKVKIGRKNPVF